MSTLDPRRLHRIYGERRPRLAYQRRDFVDYVLMIFLTGLIIYAVYGPGSVMAGIGTVLCAFMVVVFPIRHGFGFALPVVLKRPADLVGLVLCKLENIKPFYLFALAVLLMENAFIHLTPGLPHHVEGLRTIATFGFYSHFALVSLYRTAILVAHLQRRQHARALLQQTPWKAALARQPSISLEIVHAYCTGLLAHIVLIAPWYLVIRYVDFSVLALPLVVLINIVTYVKYMQGYSLWFYRDHWLGHNSEIEFLYLHGPHHDAIPSGLIGVSGNGYLEGFLRHTVGVPTACFNPLFAFVLYTWEIPMDIKNHQYIPGIWPRLPRGFHETAQHSTHHYGRLEPYSIGLKLGEPEVPAQGWRQFKLYPDSALNSVRIDEELSGFRWDNARYRRFLDLYDKYQKE